MIDKNYNIIDINLSPEEIMNKIINFKISEKISDYKELFKNPPNLTNYIEFIELINKSLNGNYIINS